MRGRGFLGEPPAWAGLATGVWRPGESAGKTAAPSPGAPASLELVCLPSGHFRAQLGSGRNGASHSPEGGRASGRGGAMRSVGQASFVSGPGPLWPSDVAASLATFLHRGHV